MSEVTTVLRSVSPYVTECEFRKILKVTIVELFNYSLVTNVFVKILMIFFFYFLIISVDL